MVYFMEQKIVENLEFLMGKIDKIWYHFSYFSLMKLLKIFQLFSHFLYHAFNGGKFPCQETSKVSKRKITLRRQLIKSRKKNPTKEWKK
jgi:hypothetical protein